MGAALGEDDVLSDSPAEQEGAQAVRPPEPQEDEDAMMAVAMKALMAKLAVIRARYSARVQALEAAQCAMHDPFVAGSKANLECTLAAERVAVQMDRDDPEQLLEKVSLPPSAAPGKHQRAAKK